MAAKRYNGNDIFLTLNGVNVEAQWVDVTLDESNAAVETTMGAGIGYVQRSAGLNDTSMQITLGYDTTAGLSTYVSTLNPGVYAVDFGPENNTVGKPRFAGDMHLANAPFSMAISKDEVSFSLSLSGADTPTASIANGDTY